MIIDLYWFKDGEYAKHKSNGKQMITKDLTFDEAYDEIRKKQAFHRDEVDEVDIILHTSKMGGHMPIDDQRVLLGAALRTLNKMNNKITTGKYEGINKLDR